MGCDKQCPHNNNNTNKATDSKEQASKPAKEHAAPKAYAPNSKRKWKFLVTSNNNLKF